MDLGRTVGGGQILINLKGQAKEHRLYPMGKGKAVTGPGMRTISPLTSSVTLGKVLPPLRTSVSSSVK